MSLITVDQANRVFHLHNQTLSYIFAVEQGGTLSHLYFGGHVDHYHGELRYPRVDRGFSGNLPGSTDRTFSRDTLPKEYSTAGEMDYHLPAAIVRHTDGANALFLVYQGYRIEAGKPKLSGLPAAFVEDEIEAETLTIVLVDQVSQVEFDLQYTIYRDRPVVTRSVQVCNQGDHAVNLEKVASMQIDFTDRQFETITLPGAHANERHPERGSINYGIQTFGSLRGTSSHQMNPFLALVDHTTTEFSGDAYGFNLVYSGNHAFELEKDQLDQLHLMVGINSYNFNWQLKAGATFQTPEVLMVYTNKGLNAMSQAYHHLIRERVVRSEFKNQERPIVVNNWEATFFDFNEAKLKPIVDEAKQLGIEMFVLDDGWFGHRDDDNSSLGDWQVDHRKFPQGLNHFVKYVHEQGLKFGIWLEPEMISYDSKLYQQHPDYLMQVPGRSPSPSRNQYILDLGRQAVRNNIFDQLDQLLKSKQIDYIKWDMNRHLSDIYSVALPPERQGEVYHRYVLGLYELLERLTTAYPHILFEGCSGGGGRFDAGMAYYMPQIWASDNTDAVARLTIQYGTSLAYPISLATAHVSVSPNQQTGRETPMSTRSAVAASGVLGYELDLTQLSSADKQIVQKQVVQYKQIRPLIQFGEFYRLKSPITSNQAAWMFVSPQQDEAIVMVFNLTSYAQPSLTKTKLVGLNPKLNYQNIATKAIFGGDELMQLGFYDPVVYQDYTTKVYHFRAVTEN